MKSKFEIVHIVFCLVLCIPHLQVEAEITRDPNFPPKLMKRVYQSFSRVCRAESNVTQESIDKFNDGEDFDNLPDDRPLKCFMMCQMVHMEMLDPLIPAVRFEIVIENIGIFTDEDRDIFVKMGRKCTKLRNKTKDACELAYLMNKCLKKGDINNYLLLP